MLAYTISTSTILWQEVIWFSAQFPPCSISAPSLKILAIIGADQRTQCQTQFSKTRSRTRSHTHEWTGTHWHAEPRAPVRVRVCAPSALWSGTNKNRDVSTGPLARPFTRSLAPLTRALAPDCSLRSRPPLRSLVRSFACSLTSLTPSLVGK